MNERQLIGDARTALLEDERDLKLEELDALSQLSDESVPSLAALAHEVRLARSGPTVEVEGILSAKTGGCPEDCHFCSQSSKFDTPVRPTPILDLDEILAAARETAELGASEFCIVAALRGPDERMIDQVIKATELVNRETGLNVAASLGILTRDAGAPARTRGTSTATTTTSRRRARSSRRSSRRTRGRSGSRRASSCARSGWSCAAALSSGWARRASRGSSCWVSCARSTLPRCRSTS